MANSKFSLGSLLNLFKSFLNSMNSPLNGFDMTDVKVNEKGDVFSSLFSFESNQQITDISGAQIKYTVLLRALNGRKVLQPLFDNIAKLPDTSVSAGDKAKLCEILGIDFGAKFEDLVQSTTEITADDTDQNAPLIFKPIPGKGLLGFDFAKGDLNESFGKFAGFDWSWGKIANDYLIYGLECQVPGAKFGSIENVKLNRCSDLITEYLMKTNKVISANEIATVDPLTLAKPILMNMQTALVKYFSQVANKITTGDKNKSAKLAEQLTEEEQKEANRQPENVAMFKQNDDGTEDIQHIDISTPEGAAQLETLKSQGWVTMSKHIDVTLQKVTGTSEVKMMAIKANYSPSEVLNDLEDVMDQAEFIDTITEEPQTFAIEVDDDGFDIERYNGCPECDPCASLCEVFKAGIRAYRNLYILHWMSSGNDMMKLHNLSEEMYDELKDEIDTVGELLVEKQGTVPQLDFPCDYIPVQEYDFQTGLTQITSLIQMYIDCIDFAYCNQDSDVQSTLDEWLRYWKKQLNYFVNRQEI